MLTLKKQGKSWVGAQDQTALVLFDVFSGQTTSSVREVLEEAKVS